MRTPRFSKTEGPVSSSCSDPPRTGRRRTSEIPKFLTVQQVAECVEASTRTVRRWIKKKLLIAHRMNGLLRVSDADFQKFLDDHRDR